MTAASLVPSMAMVAARVEDGGVAVGGTLYLPRTEETRGVAVDEKGEHHARRVLLAAADSEVGAGTAGVGAFDGF